MAMRRILNSSVSPLRFRSSGIKEAAVIVSNIISKELADARAVEERRSLYPCISPLKSDVIPDNKPVEAIEENESNTNTQATSLFSKTLAVNHPRSLRLTSVTGFLIDM